MSSPTAKFAVVGHPIKHSKSPDIHAYFAAQCGDDIRYEAIDIEPSEFDTQIRQLQAKDYLGLNVTVPFKTNAHQLADQLTDFAETAEAVNTLDLRDAKIKGHNSDGIGLVMALKQHGFAIQDQAVLIVGAGGAVQGIMKPLIDAHPASITIVNRTVSKAQQLANQFENKRCPINALDYADLEKQTDTFHGVIQATSTGLTGEVPPLPTALMAQIKWAYDMVYADQDTPFIDWAKTNGCTNLADGWSMLVAQAAESYRYWLGHNPDISQLIADRSLINKPR